MMSPPYADGSLVTWAPDVPSTWHYTITPGPMVVISSRWDDGHPTEYSMRFGGIPRQPGWIVTVEFDADSTDYYDPPRSILFGNKRLQKELHEKWLIPLNE